MRSLNDRTKPCVANGPDAHLIQTTLERVGFYEAYSDETTKHKRSLFVHGDDGYWGNRFGTHGFLHRKWVDALGYVLPPYFSSDYGDTWINDVANMLRRRVFLPILIEHMHPLWGKAQTDKTYQERMARGEKDGVKALYESMAGKRAEDAEKIKAAMTQEIVTA